MPFGGTGEGAMGALVPFPTVKAQQPSVKLQGRPARPTAPSGTAAKVIILPVVQYVRPATPAAASAAREPR